MNRQIKFRAWEKPQYNDNADGSPAISFSGRMWTDNDPKFWASCLMNKKDEYILMQFTGLLDKNGKEIYEGDLIKYSIHGDIQTMPLEVEMFNLVVGINESDAYMRIDEDSIEVIGNIYENPTLLTK